MNRTLDVVLADIFDRFPNGPLFIDHADGAAVDRGAFIAAVRAPAAQIGTAGAEGRPVAVITRHGPDSAIAITAIWLAGRVAVPLGDHLPSQVIADRLDAVGADVVLCDQVAQPAATAGASRSRRRPVVRLVGCTDPLPRTGAAPRSVPDGPEFAPGTAAVVFTSGSTGDAKAVVETQDCVIRNLESHLAITGAGPADRTALVARIGTIAGIAGLMRILGSGGSAVCVDLDRVGLAGLAGALRSRSVTIAPVLPSVFRRLAVLPDAPRVFANIRLVMLGGEPVVPADLACARRVLPPDAGILVVWGSTETPSALTRRYTPAELDPAPDDVVLTTATGGREAAIIDPQTGRECVEPGEVGELVIRGNWRTGGYLDGGLHSGRTSDRFVERPDGRTEYRTGDLARRHDDGLAIVGRVDHRVKMLGRMIDPAEIAGRLRRCPTVIDAAVVPVGGATDRRLIAVCAVGQARVAERDVRRATSAHANEPLRVARFTFVESLPVQAGGKLDHAAIRRLAEAEADRSAGPDAGGPPVGATQRRLARIWRRYGDTRQPVGPQTDFFRRGGDSLDAVDAAVTTTQRLEVRVDAVDLVTHPTLAEHAALIDRRRRDRPAGPVRAAAREERAGGDPVAAIWQFGGFPFGLPTNALAPPDMPVVRFDQPVGHGAIRRTKRPADEMLAQVQSEIAATASQTRPAAFVGWSFRGFVAWCVAAANADATGRAPAPLVLIEPTVPISALPRESAARRKLRIRSSWVAAARRRARSLAKLVVRLRRRRRHPEAWTRLVPVIRRIRLTAQLPELRADLTIIGAQRYLSDQAQVWREMGAEMITIAGRGHFAAFTERNIDVLRAAVRSAVERGRAAPATAADPGADGPARRRT
jgi:acyl-CoA synthetase (AMP-forming)/AMP-acid ligase II/thioesterase domain-containing protein/aryl carrier-like protein